MFNQAQKPHNFQLEQKHINWDTVFNQAQKPHNFQLEQKHINWDTAFNQHKNLTIFKQESV